MCNLHIKSNFLPKAIYDKKNQPTTVFPWCFMLSVLWSWLLTGRPMIWDESIAAENTFSWPQVFITWGFPKGGGPILSDWTQYQNSIPLSSCGLRVSRTKGVPLKPLLSLPPSAALNPKPVESVATYVPQGVKSHRLTVLVSASKHM